MEKLPLLNHFPYPAKLNVVMNNLATVMNTILLLPYPLRILLGPLPVKVISILFVVHWLLSYYRWSP